MAHLLGAESISLEYPTKVVFENVTVGIDEGDRIGVVGRNGDGKTTLLRMLAGRLQPDSGRVTRRGGVTIGMLDQSDALATGLTVAESIVGDRPEYEWAGDARVRDVIEGLVGDIRWDALVDDLSGGQRRRVALASVLTHDWDVVFLDEPTNHLDVEGVAWLAQHLKKRWPVNSGGLVVVTHDRWFLDEVSTDTWEVHDAIIEPFEGGYAAYILQRVERDRMAAASEFEAAEPDAQGAGLAAPRGSGPVDEAEVPDGCRRRPDRRRAAHPRLRLAREAGGQPARQGCRRPARRHRHVPDDRARRVDRVARGAASDRMADRSGGAHGHPGRQRSRQIDTARPCRGECRTDDRTGEARQDREARHPRSAAR